MESRDCSITVNFVHERSILLTIKPGDIVAGDRDANREQMQSRRMPAIDTPNMPSHGVPFLSEVEHGSVQVGRLFPEIGYRSDP